MLIKEKLEQPHQFMESKHRNGFKTEPSRLPLKNTTFKVHSGGTAVVYRI